MRIVYYLRKSCGLSRIELTKRLNSMYDCSMSKERLILIEVDSKKADEPTAKILAEFFNVALEVFQQNKELEQ